MRTCCRCKLALPESAFYPRGDRGLMYFCKACASAQARARYKANPEKFRASYRRRFYGVTPAAFETMLLAQQGRCAICKSADPKTNKVKTWCVDHDHKTGRVRGLLCTMCNRGLGFFGDKQRLLERAAQYLAEAKR